MNDTINNYIIYLRKSRADSPDMSVEDVLRSHEAQLQEYVKREFGQELPENQIFREVVSGETIADRPVMRRVMSLLETGTIKGVIVIEPQRLSRGDLEDCGRIINTFRYTNTLVITPPRNYNLQDEYDRKFFEMELTRGNDYLEYTKKILNRGRIASVKAGHFIGSIPPYGYEKIKVGIGKDAYHTLRIIPEEAETLRLMYHLFTVEGFGFTRIARYLDGIGAKPRKAEHWSPAAIKDMLENPVYIGVIRWNWRKTEKSLLDGKIVKQRPKSDSSQWISVEGKHEAIIDREVFEKALAKRGTNIKVKKGNELKNPFAGLLFCGKCGRAIIYRRCVNKRTKNNTVSETMLCNNQAICHTKSVQYNILFERIVKTLEENIADFEIQLKNDNGNALKVYSATIKSLEMDLQKLKDRDSRQKDAFEDGVYTKEEYLTRNAKVHEQIEKANKALKQARASAPVSIDYAEKISRFTDCLNALKNPEISITEKNMLLKACVEKIVYYNNGESKPGIGRYVENKFELDVFLK